MNWIFADKGKKKNECLRCLQCQLAKMTWVEGNELMKKPTPLPPEEEKEGE